MEPFLFRAFFIYKQYFKLNVLYHTKKYFQLKHTDKQLCIMHYDLL